MAGILDFLTGAAEGYVGTMAEQQKMKMEQANKIEQIMAEARAKQAAAASDPMTQLLYRQLGIGAPAPQPVDQSFGPSGLELQGVTLGRGTPSIRFGTSPERRAQAGVQAKPLTSEASTTVSSAESAMGAIDELLDLERRVPNVIRTGLIPGVPPFGSMEAQTADLLLKRLQTEITTARGGKQLTQAEMKFIGQLLPTIWRRGKVNIKGLNDLRNTLVNIRDRILTPRGQQKEVSAQEIGSIISRGGRSYKIVDFDTDGEPLVDLVR